MTFKPPLGSEVEPTTSHGGEAGSAGTPLWEKTEANVEKSVFLEIMAQKRQSSIVSACVLSFVAGATLSTFASEQKGGPGFQLGLRVLPV